MWAVFCLHRMGKLVGKRVNRRKIIALLSLSYCDSVESQTNNKVCSHTWPQTSFVLLKRFKWCWRILWSLEWNVVPDHFEFNLLFAAAIPREFLAAKSCMISDTFSSTLYMGWQSSLFLKACMSHVSHLESNVSLRLKKRILCKIYRPLGWFW